MIVLLSLLFVVVLTGGFVVAGEVLLQSEDYYCGTSWADAAQSCSNSCVSGEDSECNLLAMGEGHGCYGFTGCHAKLLGVAAGDDISQGGAAPDEAEAPDDDYVTDNNFCGESWVGAMLSCSDPCPTTTECISPAKCYTATNCKQPLEQLVSELLSTLSGPDNVMENEDLDIFGGTLQDFIKARAEVEGVSLMGVEPAGQSVAGRRELQRYLNFDIANITARRLPTGSSALDVSIVVTGDYRPPPYLDLDVIAEESINRNGDAIVSTLRDRGSRKGRGFFEKVQGIVAVRAGDVTKRPSKAPIGTPKIGPSKQPTLLPSMMLSSNPSSAPSSVPSMTIDRVITLGSASDLSEQDTTTSSNGFIFNIRTKTDAPVVLVTGLDFYTESTEEVIFEVWSRIGNFKKHKADKEGWDLIASGTTIGQGVGRYTHFPDETFTPVDIPGGGGDKGTRAFFITLHTKDLAYRVPDLEGEKESDVNVIGETPEIEIYEGEGVLHIVLPDEIFSIPPFPDVNESMFWSTPRQFLGMIRYDRLPCKPFSVYGLIDEMPCPFVPTGSPTITPPTTSPVVRSPSTSPISASPTSPLSGSPFVGQTPAPINPETDIPTMTVEPTLLPTTSEPTLSPVVSMRANIITTLRNVPDREMTPRESEKYIELLIVFLKRYTGNIMVLDGADVWHQELTVMDAKNGFVAANATFSANATDAGKEGIVTTSPQDARSENGDWARKLKASAVSDAGPNGPIRKKHEIPKVAAMDVTLILRVTFSNLPSNLIGSMASVTIQKHEQILLDLLHEQQAFYTFFKLVDGVRSRVIDEITPTPTDTPSSYAYFVAQQEALLLVETEAEEDAGVGFGVKVGLGIGFLWFCLTAISIALLLSAQNEMKERRDMEELLRADKTQPATDTTIPLREDASIENPLKGDKTRPPMLTDDQRTFDRKKNARFAIEARKSIGRAGTERPGERSNFRRNRTPTRHILINSEERYSNSAREKWNQSKILPTTSNNK